MRKSCGEVRVSVATGCMVVVVVVVCGVWRSAHRTGCATVRGIEHREQCHYRLAGATSVPFGEGHVRLYK